MGAPITQASAHANHVVEVYPDRVEIRSGWQGQNVESLDMRDIERVDIKGFVNCKLTISTNKGRLLDFTRMSLPEARAVKKAVESQKQRAGLHKQQ